MRSRTTRSSPTRAPPTRSGRAPTGRPRDRSYTVRVVNTPPPETGRESNTLYGGGSDFAGFVLRVYKPDRGLDASGGVGLPTLTIVAADGPRTTIPQCPDAGPLDRGLSQVEANAGVALPPPGTGLAFRNPPRWHKFTNNTSLMTDLALDNEATRGAAADPLTDQFDARLPGGGIGETKHNSYAYTGFSPDHGQVLVLRGKAPTAVPTFEGDPTMGSGQLRYWSLCSYSVYTVYYACLDDESIPVDAGGRYTIAVSTPRRGPPTPPPAVASAGSRAAPGHRPTCSSATCSRRRTSRRRCKTWSPVARRSRWASTTRGAPTTPSRAAVERLGCP